ncbi:50S ribosomal protein L3 [bacterium]|nr:50S ribosomal protein L3 [bacterium]MBU1652225.1 50S ribosomal protein L3 [bacterium]
MSFALARKIGMTRIFDDDGNHVPVTVLEIGPCWVVQVKRKETDGYNAVQVGFGAAKEKALNTPKLGHLKKFGVEPLRHLKEFCTDEIDEYKSGDLLEVERFKAGQEVSVAGYSKGRGFAGVFKRHGFHGPNATHGSHEAKRHGGSIGAHTDPGRVWKGHRMPGHYGVDRVTVKNLSIVKVEPEQNLMMIRGAVPGARNALVEIVVANH